MTLSQLAATVALPAGLDLLAYRVGISTIPAFLLAGLVLGPNEPKIFSLVEPSEATDFVAELGVIFLLVFLGLEFNLEKLGRSGRFFTIDGSIDLVVNGVIGA